MDREVSTIAHLTTVDLSLRFLLFAQLEAVRGLGIRSVGISAPGPWVEGLERDGIEHRTLPTSSRGWGLIADFRAAIDLYRILRSTHVDVLHTHNPKPGVYGRLVGRMAGVPIVVNTVHGLYATEDDRWFKRAIVYLLEAIASRASDAELYQNVEDMRLLRRLRLVEPGRQILLGNGVDLVRFDAERARRVRSRVRAELDLTDDDIAVGTVGRLVAEKGYPELFEAAEALDSTCVVLAIGPDDPSKPDALDRAVVERGRRAGVRFLGMREDVEDLYAALDVFVLPSHREGFPRAAMEAAASGLPVVATDIRGCRQVVDDGVNGFLVEVGDVDGLAGAIGRLASDADLRAQMSEASVRKAQVEFDEKSVVKTVVDTYRHLARAKDLTGLSAALGGAEAPIGIREARPSDIAFMADLHRSAISTGFLSRLGARFMRLLYRSILDQPGGVCLVAEDASGPVGFVAGVPSTAGLYRRFVRRFGLRAGLLALPRLIIPSNLKRAWETFRYGDEHNDGDVPELISMAVVSDARDRGLGTRLGQEFLERATEVWTSCKVVVGSENRRAIAAYRRMGFAPHHTIEVHAGESSEVLMWTVGQVE